MGINTSLTFPGNRKKVSIKEEILKQKMFDMNTGGVGTSTKFKKPKLYDPKKPLFTFNQGFETLDEIDGKFLKDYLHL